MAQGRPTLVTAICIYEALAGLAALGGEIFSQFIYYAVSPGAHTFQLNPLHSATVLFSAILSFGIASTLWWMRREAFFLSCTKILLNLFSLISLLYVFTSARFHIASSLRGNSTAMLIILVPRVFDALFILLGIAITLYIYRVTIATPPPPLSPGTTGEYIP